jgi:hypothetical protein
MMTTSGLSTSSTHVVTHARMPLCLAPSAPLPSAPENPLFASPSDLRATVASCAHLPRLTKTQRHASLTALQSP